MLLQVFVGWRAHAANIRAMFITGACSMHIDTHDNTAARHALAWLLGAGFVYLVAIFAGSALMQLFGLALNAHGHTHVHAHVHPFIDARTFALIPNFWDVVTNLPFLFVGGWGLLAMRGLSLQPITHSALQVFFIGLILTCFGSSYYHWAPESFGLALDRLGMAVAFAGVITLALAERFSLALAQRSLWAVLAAAALAAFLPHVQGNVLPWALIQFGGIALVLIATFRAPLSCALNIRWGLVIAWYALAKVLEMQDTAVFELTGELISGHSLKHLAAACAAWPVIRACYDARQKQTA
jgi:hypothetical protein